jgi:diguanylate cyclase (GGDEF)-like protein/PAS domain S-box-containing protein
MRPLRSLSTFGRAVERLEALGSLRRWRAAGNKKAQCGQKHGHTPDDSLDVIATIGVDRVFRTVSPACKTILGYEPEELIGRSYMDLVHPDDRDRSAMLITAIAGGVAEVRLENRLRRKDGSIAWIEWRAVAQPEEGAVYCLARDLTNRKRAGEEIRRLNETLDTRLMERIDKLEATIAELEHDKHTLQEREKRFRVMLSNVSDLITVIGADGTVYYENISAVERLLGYRPEIKAKESNAFEWIHQNDVERALSLFAEVLSNPGVHPPIEFPVPHADGSERHFEHTINNLVDDPEVGGIVISSRDITERKALQEQLAHQASHDFLTELPNRALFMDRLEHALTRAKRRRIKVAVLLVDLDDFKLINDGLGHEMGDRLLVAVAKRLQTCLRHADTAARLGGDEFAILLEDITDVGEATRVAERIAGALREPFILGGRQLLTSASIGVVLGTPTHDEPKKLLRGADLAMYQAKGSGKARYSVLDPSTNARALKHLESRNDLR